MKTCSKCALEKEFIDFHKDRSRPDGYGDLCKPCARARSKDWKLKNPEKSKISARKYRESAKGQSKSRGDHYRREYWPELSSSEALAKYDEILLSQDNKCAVCRVDQDGQSTFHVDHHHGTGRVRGLLCENCNPGIGYFKDSVDILMSAVKYLEATNV